MVTRLPIIDKYLLYIDILGFKNLVQNDVAKVHDAYQILDNLNVHKHDVFNTIVFSDTVLVYNKYNPTTEADHSYIVMFACEFAQDLLHRFVGQNLFFRALLTYGNFDHYKRRNIECFFGPALIKAYEQEKNIQSQGLFVDNNSNQYNDIFKTSRYDSDLSFVYLTQALDRLHQDTQGIFPANPILFDNTDDAYFLLPEIRLLQDTHHFMINHLDPKVRTKHLTAWHFYRSRYGTILDDLERESFRPEFICTGYDWTDAKRVLKRDHKCTVGYY